MKRLFFFVIISIAFNSSLLAVTEATLYLNSGQMSIGSTTVQKLSFNSTSIFDQENTILGLTIGEPLNLTIVNNDIYPHNIAVDGIIGSVEVFPSSSVELNYQFDSFGTYAVRSVSSSGNMLGAAAIIQVGIPSPSFSWDLWDIEAESSAAIYNGTITVLPEPYRPNVFTINGYPYSDHMAVPGMITGMVGQEIYISICNSGNMTHTVHFHGYHVEIIQANKRDHVIGWMKDSFPVTVGESMTVKLVPHQPGEFPVHNHNLVTNLTNNAYPGGMMTMIMIME